MEERRRSPRKTVEGHSMAVHSAESVRIVDLSATGVLFHSQDPVGVREKALLRLSMGGAPFAAEVEVTRVGPASQTGEGYRIAAQFPAITPNHRQLIERFISQ